MSRGRHEREESDEEKMERLGSSTHGRLTESNSTDNRGADLLMDADEAGGCSVTMKAGPCIIEAVHTSGTSSPPQRLPEALEVERASAVSELIELGAQALDPEVAPSLLQRVELRTTSRHAARDLRLTEPRAPTAATPPAASALARDEVPPGLRVRCGRMGCRSESRQGSAAGSSTQAASRPSRGAGSKPTKPTPEAPVVAAASERSSHTKTTLGAALLLFTSHGKSRDGTTAASA